MSQNRKEHTAQYYVFRLIVLFDQPNFKCKNFSIINDKENYQIFTVIETINLLLKWLLICCFFAFISQLTNLLIEKLLQF